MQEFIYYQAKMFPLIIFLIMSRGNLLAQFIWQMGGKTSNVFHFRNTEEIMFQFDLNLQIFKIKDVKRSPAQKR